MANPTLPTATASYSDEVDASTGIRFLKSGAKPSDSPTAFERLSQLQEHLFLLMARVAQGAAVRVNANRDIGVFAMEYQIGSTEYSYAGDASVTLDASATTYLWLDTDETLKSSTSAWPSGSHVKIAKITCDATQVTSLLDCRLMNFLIGTVNEWWTIAPTATADFDDQGIENLGNLHLSGPDDKTIGVSGIVNPDYVWTRLDTYGGAASDDLTTLTYTVSAYGDLLILSCADGARVVTVKDGAAINLRGGDCVLDDPEKFLVLIGMDGAYTELFRSEQSPRTLSADMDFDGNSARDVGKFNLYRGSDLTIASGAITPVGSHHRVKSEGGGATDTLDTIGAGTYRGQLLLLTSGSAGETITVAHGAGEIVLANEIDCVLDDPNDKYLLLVWNGDDWAEVCRSHRNLSDLVGTDEAIPYAIGPCHYPGALSDTQETWHYIAPVPFTLKLIRGYVVTSPTSTNCIVHAQKNGASIHANDADAISITPGNQSDDSAQEDVAFDEGDRLSIYVKTASAAEDLTVAIDAYTGARTKDT